MFVAVFATRDLDVSGTLAAPRLASNQLEKKNKWGERLDRVFQGRHQQVWQTMLAELGEEAVRAVLLPMARKGKENPE